MHLGHAYIHSKNTFIHTGKQDSIWMKRVFKDKENRNDEPLSMKETKDEEPQAMGKPNGNLKEKEMKPQNRTTKG